MKLGRALSLFLAIAATHCSQSGTSTPAPTTPTPATCAFALAATSQAAPAGGGSFAVSITKTSGSCTWTASTDATWITFSGAASGSDSATLNYAVAANAATTSRTGTITVSWQGGSQQLAVTEAGTPAPAACTNSAAPGAQAVPVEGGAFTAAVSMTGSGCGWTASSDVSWIAITSGSSGAASGTVSYTVTANPDANERTGAITIQWPTGSARVVVTQAGVANCIYTLSPATQAVAAAGATGLSFTATRNTQNGCSWSVSTTTPWITLTGATTGLSPGLITYSAAANTGAARTGTITVVWSGGSADVTVQQAAATTAPTPNISFALLDPGRSGATPTTECQIRSATNVPTTCTLVATASLPTAIVSYDWSVSYLYGFQRVILQNNASPTLTFMESCGQFSASDLGTIENLSVRLTVTDAVGNTATATAGAGAQPPLQLKLFTCGL